MFLTGIVFTLALGSFGSAGMGAMANLEQAAGDPIAVVVLSGALFNVSNILLVVVIAKTAILENGGRMEVRDGESYYVVNSDPRTSRKARGFRQRGAN